MGLTFSWEKSKLRSPPRGTYDEEPTQKKKLDNDEKDNIKGMEFGIWHDPDNKSFFALASFAIFDCYDNAVANFKGKYVASET